MSEQTSEQVDGPKIEESGAPTKNINAQKRAKTTLKAKFTRCKNKIFELAQETDPTSVVEIKSAQRTLNEIFDELVEVSTRLSEMYESLGQFDSGSKVLDEIDEVIEKYNSVEIEIRRFISESSTSTSSKVTTWLSQQQDNEKEVYHKVGNPTTAREQTVNRNPIQTSHFRPGIGSDMWRQLDRVSIPKFNGSKQAYPSWKAAFMACIDEAPVTAEYKLLQLRQSLQGEPLRVIENLGHSEEAYNAAKALLERKYGGERRFISLYLDELDRFRPIKDGPSKALEKFADLMDVLVVNLSKAGMEHELGYGTFYIKLQRKLSENMLTNYRRWIMDTGKAESVLSLREFVLREAEFSLVASETINGCEKKDSQRGSAHQKTFFGDVSDKQNSEEMLSLKCICCSQNHPLWKCLKFKSMSIQNRWKFVTQSNLCYCCLGRNHVLKNCEKIRSCGIEGCKKLHNRLLHKNAELETSKDVFENKNSQGFLKAEVVSAKENVTSNSDAKVPNQNQTTLIAQSSFAVAMRIVPIVLQHKKRKLEVNALLDDCSTKTYINSDVAAELGLEGRRELMKVNVLNGKEESFESQPVTMILKNLSGTIRQEITAWTTEKVTGELEAIPWHKIKNKWKHLSTVPFPKISNRRVDMLIGLDYLELMHSIKEVSGSPGEPVARLTPLGWTCVGELNVNRLNIDQTYFTYFLHEQLCRREDELQSINEQLKRFWEIEDFESNVPSIMRTEDRAAIRTAENSLKWTGERYEVSIPWRIDPSKLPNNYKMALNRLQSTEKKLLKDSELFCAYRNVISSYIDKGYISKVDRQQDSTSNQWLLPHFPILRPEKRTTKVRIVFDASAKCDNICLNDFILAGPKLQCDLVNVLLRFRKGKVALVCDVAEMYMQIKIAEKDRQFVRFLWRDLDQSRSPDIFQFNRVAFGLNASPFLSQYVTQQHAQKHCNEFGRAADTILKSTYMDDSMDSVDSDNEAIELFYELSNLWRLANMHPRKWVSNSKRVMNVVPECDRALGIDVNAKGLPTVKTLGLWWKAETDCFEYKISFKIEIPIITKRIWLSKVSTVFDPLGFVSPFIVQARILIQQIWVKGYDWDESIIDNIENDCREWLEQLPQLTRCKVSRWVGMNETVQKTTFHVFVDASELAYGAVCYARHELIKNKTVTTELVLSKAKVAPLTALSIPKLELLAAVVGTEIAKVVAAALNVTHKCFTFWADSMNVLWWVRGCSRSFKPFVAHRVGKIQTEFSPSQWRHVPSKQNPADLISRGCNVGNLIDNEWWWHGPKYLFDDIAKWPVTSIQENDCKMKKSKNSSFYARNVTTIEVKWKLSPDRFSSWKRLLNVQAFVYRFIENCKVLPDQRKKGRVLQADEIAAAETRILKAAQLKHFPSEYAAAANGKQVSAKSRLQKLNPKLDTEGVLRCGGRLSFTEHLSFSARCPIILSNNSWVTTLIIKFYHEKVKHFGVNYTLAALSSKFWILSAREEIKKWQKQCAICIKNKAKPINQIMALLPDNRPSIPFRAFTRIAIDFAGPFVTIQGRGKKRNKRYLCLFTCLACRAVHLEMTYGLDTDAFLSAFFRMVNRRGYPDEVITDNAGNFVAADKDLKKLGFNISQERVEHQLADASVKPIAWKFIPPFAPHFGGVHEAMIKSAKKAIKVILGSADINDEELHSAFVGAEAIMNSRPITYQSADPIEDVPLTPNHFIIGLMGNSFAPETDLETAFIPRKRWRRVQELIRHFWKRWLKEWVPALNARPKWRVERNNLKIGDLVLVLTYKTPRTQWPLGKIIDVHPGRDGHVRVVTVQMAKAVITRPITQICPLI